MNIKIDKRMFNDAYLPYVFSYQNKIEVYMGGAGSGKSHFVAQKILIKALNNKRKILIIRKVGATLRDSVWQMILDTLSTFGVYDDAKINKTEMRIELPNGSVFLFKGMDDEQKIKSIAGISDCWIEEASEILPEEFAQLKLRVRAKTNNNQIWLSYNPISMSNWVYNAFHNEETKDKNAFVLKTTYLDNKFLPDDYIESLLEMKRTNPYHYEVYALGNFGALGKTIYNNWTTKRLNKDKLLKYNPKLEVCAGIDFGFNHKYAICVCLVDIEERICYIVDEFYRSNVTNDDAYKWIVENGYNKFTFMCDSASPRDIEELRRLGLRVQKCKKGKNSIYNGITRLSKFKVVIDESCEGFISEITTYSWKKDKEGNYIDEPVKINDDMMDCWRYAMEKVISNTAKVTILSKNLFGL